MAKIVRKTALLFGVSSGLDQIAQFGSLALGVPVFSTDPSVIQSLSAWIDGWFSAIIGSNSPAIEDMNAAFFVLSYMICSIMQDGIPEYDSGTTYYTGSFASSSGIIYTSLVDNNIGNALTDLSKWKQTANRTFQTVTASTPLTASANIVRSDSTSGNLTQTLPTIASSIGQIITVKDVGTGGFATTLQGNGAELIDGTNVYPTVLQQYNTLTVFNNGTTWDTL